MSDADCKPNILRSSASNSGDTKSLPDGSNEISPQSKSTSRCTTNGSPLWGSKRSALSESFHALICEARIACSIFEPVTAHRWPQIANTSRLNWSWPQRASTSDFFVVAVNGLRMISSISCRTSRGLSCVNAISSTRTVFLISAKVLLPTTWNGPNSRSSRSSKVLIVLFLVACLSLAMQTTPKPIAPLEMRSNCLRRSLDPAEFGFQLSSNTRAHFVPRICSC